jgi:hypothetical protein
MSKEKRIEELDSQINDVEELLEVMKTYQEVWYSVEK